MYDTDTTYYLPLSCIKVENGSKRTPYGEFTRAYVLVTYTGDGYKYFFTGTDTSQTTTNTNNKVVKVSSNKKVSNTVINEETEETKKEESSKLVWILVTLAIIGFIIFFASSRASKSE